MRKPPQTKSPACNALTVKVRLKKGGKAVLSRAGTKAAQMLLV